MGLFGGLVKGVIDTALLPVAAVKDVVTMGGLADGHGSYLKEKLEDIVEDAEDMDE